MMNSSPAPPVPPHHHQQYSNYPYIQPSPTPTAISQNYIDEKYEAPNLLSRNEKHPLSSSATVPVRPPPPPADEQDLESNYSTKNLPVKRRPFSERGCCVRCCCCACLPRWARYVVWGFIIAILIVVIVIGSIFATFKMPTFGFVGLASAPGTTGSNSNSFSSLSTSAFSVTDGRFNFQFGLRVDVNNPNIFPLHFTSMNATAYYPSETDPSVKTPIGGGFLASQWIPANTNMTFTYPFSIDYDPALDSDQSVLSSLTDKCGLTGDEPQDLSIDYTIELAASALFVTIYPTISSSAQFPCPLNAGMLQGVSSDTVISSLLG